jgi:putative PIN family toxin of toxin-antitoxin system
VTIVAVLDANVLASGVVAARQPSSVPGRLVRLWEAGAFELAVSDHIRAEVISTLREPYFQQRISPAQRGRFAALLRYRVRRVEISGDPPRVATHPEDDLVLAAAVSAGAAYLVTGDRRLRARVTAFEGVRLISPADFLSVLRAQGRTP